MVSPTERRKSSEDVAMTQSSAERQEEQQKDTDVIDLDSSGNGSEGRGMPEQQNGNSEEIEVLGDPRTAAPQQTHPASQATQPVQTEDQLPSNLQVKRAGSASNAATASPSLPIDEHPTARTLEQGQQAQQQQSRDVSSTSQRKRKPTSSEVPGNKRSRPSNDGEPAGGSSTIGIQQAQQQGQPSVQWPPGTRVADLAAPGGFAYPLPVPQAQDQHQQPTFLNPSPHPPQQQRQQQAPPPNPLAQQQQQQQASLPVLYAIRLSFHELGRSLKQVRQFQRVYRSYESAVDAVTSDALQVPQLRERAIRVTLTMLDGTVQDALIPGHGLGLNGQFEIVDAEIYQVVVVPEDREWARRQA